MQQDRGSDDQDMKQNNQQEDRRLKLSTAADNQPPQPQQQQQPQPPQKCPRCESPNTKFCYYNNYSLSQPRYFCKTCRRYWTQGGTLRNVPVGGGCRKGKRTKTYSGESSRPQPPLIPQQQNLTTVAQSVISSNPMISSSSALKTKESSGSLASPSSAISSMGSYYPGAGFFSSMAAIQSMNLPQPSIQPLNQAFGIVGELGGSSNLGLLQGFGGVPSSFGSQQQHQQIQQTQFFHMGNREKIVNMYPSHHHDQETLIQSSRPTSGSSHHHQNWHQSFINTGNPTVSEAGLWSINNSSNSSSSAGTTNTSNTAAATSLNPNQWPDLPRYGSAPP